MEHRSDIEALRAFAVGAVILNHVNGDWLPSGHLGVDVFFVVSGYVITHSIRNRTQTSLLSFLGGFYSRRVKRLLPALALCALACSVAIMLIDPFPAKSIDTAGFGVLGLANLYLHGSAQDYFSAEPGYNAFLHLWSLGIEEQFYLILPLLIWFAGGRHEPRIRLLAVFLGLLTAVSSIAYWRTYDSDPISAFYLLQYRFWELGIGVLIALVYGKKQRSSGDSRFNFLALIALGLCGASMLGGFNGAGATFVAVMSTGVLLVLGPGLRLLQGKLLGYVGQLSYSLYIWHWPLLVIQRLVFQKENLILYAATLVLASMASFHFVESPLRRANWKLIVPNGYVVALSPLVIAMILLVAARQGSVTQSTIATIPFAAPAGSEVVPLEKFSTAFVSLPSGKPYNPTCVVDHHKRVYRESMVRECTFALEDEKAPTIWAFGDSHVGHYQGLLVKLYELGLAGFSLIETPGRLVPIVSHFAGDSRAKILEEAGQMMRPGDVVLISRLYFTRGKKSEAFSNLDAWVKAVDRLAAQMNRRSINLLVVGPVPMFEFQDIRDCKGNKIVQCGVPRSSIASRAEEVHRKLRDISERNSNVSVFDPLARLCHSGPGSCYPAENGISLMRDSDHLSVHGAEALVQNFYRVIERRKFDWEKDRRILGSDAKTPVQ